MFRAAYRSSSGALTVFAASGLHTHVVTGRSQVGTGHLDWLFLKHAMRFSAFLFVRCQDLCIFHVPQPHNGSGNTGACTTAITLRNFAF
jgi:hypothetical protein